MLFSYDFYGVKIGQRHPIDLYKDTELLSVTQENRDGAHKKRMSNVSRNLTITHSPLSCGADGTRTRDEHRFASLSQLTAQLTRDRLTTLRPTYAARINSI